MPQHTSTWLDNINLGPARAPLVKDISADVVIVGGGLAGTLTAYLLSKAGKKVVLLEKKDIANSVTAYTTAWLDSAIDTSLVDLVKMYGSEGARKVWQSGIEAISLIETIIRDEKIECEFMRVSHYTLAYSQSDCESLQEEREVATRLGFKTTLHQQNIFNFPNLGALEIPGQAKFHPIKFLLGLQKAAEKYGAEIYEQTEALDLAGVKRVTVKTKEGSVTADYSVVTTYQPFKKLTELFAHLGTYITYVFEVEITKGLIPEGLYEDEANPYHYFRIDAGEKTDRMILGGEDHRKEIPIKKEKNFRALTAYLDTVLAAKQYTIKKQWSGPILETIDGLPYIGRYSKKYSNRLVATGFSGNGMTYSAISALILRDIILKQENPYTQIYHAGRPTKAYNFLKKFIFFAQEFFGGVVKNIFK